MSILDPGPPPSGGIITVEAAHVAVIGDIHGRADRLAALLERLPGDVQIVVVGDVCDRGPSTHEVVDMLIERGAAGARGNHEEWFLAWASGGRFDASALAIGGDATLLSYGVRGRDAAQVEAQRDKVPRAHVEWLERLGLAVDLRVGEHRYWVVHAGIPSWDSFEGMGTEQVVPWLVEHRASSLLWAFNDPETMPPLDRPVIMGHVVRRRPVDTGDVLAIDTGCGTIADGRLSAVLLPERRFVTVGDG